MYRTHLLTALVALLAPACGFAYEVDPGPADAASDAAPDAPHAFDRCAFQGYDDPLRYAAVLGSSANALSWDDARGACIRRGMDLAVMNDPEELGMVDADQWPAWVGVSQATASSPWVAVDGCPAMSPAPTAPRLAAAAATSCGFVQTAGQVSPTTCDGTLATGGDAQVVTRALCETPRPDSDACLRDPNTESYQASPVAFAYADAVTYCQSQHMHLIVFDTQAELTHISNLVPVIVDEDFWIGEQWDGTAWHAETTCPGEFSWTDGGAATASLTSAASCTDEIVSNGPVGDPDNPSVLKMRGQELADCATKKIALCEKE